MITFHAGLEAFLIVGIILAYLAQTKQTELNKHVYAATGLAIPGSIGAAPVFNALAIEFAGINEELFEGNCHAHSSSSAHFNDDLDGAREQAYPIKYSPESGLKPCARPVRTCLYREGIETALFLCAAAIKTYIW